MANNNSKTIISAYYKPPFKIHIYYKDIYSISPTTKIFFVRVLAAFIHEIVHMIQFFTIAHGNKNYFGTIRYNKIAEQQAYLFDYWIGKLFGVEIDGRYDYKGKVKAVWKQLDERTYGKIEN